MQSPNSSAWLKLGVTLFSTFMIAAGCTKLQSPTTPLPPTSGGAVGMGVRAAQAAQPPARGCTQNLGGATSSRVAMGPCLAQAVPQAEAAVLAAGAAMPAWVARLSMARPLAEQQHEQRRRQRNQGWQPTSGGASTGEPPWVTTVAGTTTGGATKAGSTTTTGLVAFRPGRKHHDEWRWRCDD